MKKKFLGIKIGTIIQFLVCVILAFIIWFVVQYTNSQVDHNDSAMIEVLTSHLS